MFYESHYNNFYNNNTNCLIFSSKYEAEKLQETEIFIDEG